MMTNLTDSTYSCPMYTKTSSGFAMWPAVRHLKCDLGFQTDEERAVGARMHGQVHLSPVIWSPLRMASL
jgi:hypothetical protein